MILKGYITSREFLGERVPQHVQNIIIRDYCNKKEFEYILSATEYAMPGSTLMMKQIILELDLFDGIVAYSIFQLPQNLEERFKIVNNFLRLNKQIHFACENMKITNRDEFEKIENIWQIKQSLSSTDLTGD